MYQLPEDQGLWMGSQIRIKKALEMCNVGEVINVLELPVKCYNSVHTQ